MTLSRFSTLPAICAFLFVVSGVSAAPSSPAWPSGVQTLQVSAGVASEVKGNLVTGKTIDLAWAANSSVACFPATRFDPFRGNHVTYATTLPKESILKITAVPDDAGTDLSVYAYTIGTTDFTHTPPNVPSVTSCEAAYEAMGKPNPGASEAVTLNATTNPYNVVIAVVGAKGVVTGGYTLKLELTSKAAASTNQLAAIPLASKPNGTVTVSGNLESGKTIDLAWAANSSVACFPATRFDPFRGNHVAYITSLPKQSILKITATPDNAGTDLSVYAYSIGTTDSSHIPPNVPSATSCEAGYETMGKANPGAAEKVTLNATTNAYNVIIGVAGAKGVLAGGYTLKLELATKEAAPTTQLKATQLTANPNGVVTVNGNLESGAKIDLAFAARSAVACWPATRDNGYNGNHVVYRTSLPAYSDVTVTATPSNGTSDIGVYAYTVGTGDTKSVPPSVYSAVSCEAASAAGAGKPESVSLNAMQNPYTLYIGVVGAEGSTAGAFTLKVETKPKK